MIEIQLSQRLLVNKNRMAKESRFVQATVTLHRGRQPDRLEQAAGN